MPSSPLSENSLGQFKHKILHTSKQNFEIYLPSPFMHIKLSGKAVHKGKLSKVLATDLMDGPQRNYGDGIFFKLFLGMRENFLMICHLGPSRRSSHPLHFCAVQRHMVGKTSSKTVDNCVTTYPSDQSPLN